MLSVFDRFNAIKIDLPKNTMYHIVSTAIIDGKDKIKQNGSGYLKPFSVQGKGEPLSNYFTLNSNQAMALLKESEASLVHTRVEKANDEYVLSNLDRYHGEVVNYSGDSPENPEIDMKRTIFGVLPSLEDMDGIEEGRDVSFFIYVSGAPDTLMVTNKEGGVRDVEKVYTLMDESKQNWFRTKWWCILDDEEPSVGADYNVFEIYRSAQMYVKINPIIGNGVRDWNEKVTDLA